MSGGEVTKIWVSEYITPEEIYQHGVRRILDQRVTKFQELTVVETAAYGRGMVLDGKWQVTEGDEFMYHEPLVHVPMICHGDPKKVLILGGGDGGSLREVLKWKSVERAVMVDIDVEVVNAAKEFLAGIHQNAFDDPRAEVIIDDALNFIAQTGERFDVIISDLTDPLEDGPAFRLFTKEHMENCRKVLSDDGFFSLQAGSAAPGDHYVHLRVVNTTKAAFPHAGHYMSHTPTYGVPLGFALGGNAAFDPLRDPAEVDRLLAEKTLGGFQYIDGQALIGLLHPPRYLTKGVEDETVVYTLAAPPKAYGKGILGQEGKGDDA